MAKRKFDVTAVMDDEDPEFQIAPMIDVLLVLLIFFMSITTTDVMQKNQDIILPTAIDGKKKEKNRELGQAIINIAYNAKTKRGDITLNDNAIPAPDFLTTEVDALRQNYIKIVSNGKFRVLVRADEKVMYRDLKDIMAACAKAGVVNITYSVIQDGEYTKGIPAKP